MQIFKTRWFDKWAKKQHLSDGSLFGAVQEMSDGLIDANLGGHVYKKRVAIAGRGKRGSLRTIIAFQMEDKAFYVYGFSKGKRANIRDDELKVFKLIAADLLNNDRAGLMGLLNMGELVELETNE